MKIRDQLWVTRIWKPGTREVGRVQVLDDVDRADPEVVQVDVVEGHQREFRLTIPAGADPIEIQVGTHFITIEREAL